MCVCVYIKLYVLKIEIHLTVSHYNPTKGFL